MRILIPGCPVALCADLVFNLGKEYPRAIGAYLELGDDPNLQIDLWDRTVVLTLQTTPSPPKK